MTEKLMDVRELIGLGILQAINLEVLHPLGLALRATLDDTNTAILDVLDERNDPEGFRFGEDYLGEYGRASRITYLRLMREHVRTRYERLGYVIQPIPGRYCRFCGCTEDHACDGGCSWRVEPDQLEPGICSACFDDVFVKHSDLPPAGSVVRGGGTPEVSPTFKRKEVMD